MIDVSIEIDHASITNPMNETDGLNRRHILYNLEEAREEIDLVIRDLMSRGPR